MPNPADASGVRLHGDRHRRRREHADRRRRRLGDLRPRHAQLALHHGRELIQDLDAAHAAGREERLGDPGARVVLANRVETDVDREA